jgi:hypothetical protein
MDTDTGEPVAGVWALELWRLRAGSTKLALELSPKLMRFHVARWFRAVDRHGLAFA